MKPAEQTAVGRARRRPALTEEPTRKLPRAAAWSADSIALLGAALLKEKLLPLLEGLAVAPRGPAQSYANHLLALDSASRKARLARDFGERSDASLRIHALLHEAPDLKAELWRRLPVHHQRSHPELATLAPESVCPARAALLDRLVKEALR